MVNNAVAIELGEQEGAILLPGLVNAHSHAFHRALRGLSETRAGNFWTWRELMYEVAGRLDPDSYRELATYTYAEMLLAGYSTVGEFHYLHHGPDGRPYSDPNAMSWALLEAAAAAGIRITLLDTCYLQAGVGGEALEGVQLRFGDGSGENWARRADEAAHAKGRFGAGRQGSRSPARFGVAIHSVRAVAPPAMQTVASFAAYGEYPLHVHLSEQRQETESCLATYQSTPTDLLQAAGALSARMTAVHATHVTALDVSKLGFARCGICACPTTERDLGDGVGPFFELADSGAVLSLGSDSHVVIDPFEEMRSLEWHQRLVTEARGIMSLSSLLAAGSTGGGRCLGWDLEELAGDQVTLAAAGSLGLAGYERAEGENLLATVLFGAAPSAVDTVTVDGKVVVEGGEHTVLGPRRAVAERLSSAIGRVLDS